MYILSHLFFSASHSVNVNVVLALCPWYIRISISTWPQAGGPLSIPVKVVSATHWADIKRWDSPLWRYHVFCMCKRSDVSSSAGKTLLGERKTWFLTVCDPNPSPLYIHTHTFLLLSCLSSHLAFPCGKGFTHVLFEARSYSAVPSVILLLIKPPSRVMVRAEAANISKASACTVIHVHKSHVFHLITLFTASIINIYVLCF